MEFNFVLSEWPKNVKEEKTVEWPTSNVDGNLVWKLISYSFNYSKLGYEIKFPTKVSSFRVLVKTNWQDASLCACFFTLYPILYPTTLSHYPPPTLSVECACHLKTIACSQAFKFVFNQANVPIRPDGYATDTISLSGRVLMLRAEYINGACAAWCSEIGSLTSLDAPEFHASSDVREPISLHQAVRLRHSSHEFGAQPVLLWNDLVGMPKWPLLNTMT